ncbi:MAG TPA: exosortase/archaeosortase family protein [Candidatus Dormibacteraeota bacterium]
MERRSVYVGLLAAGCGMLLILPFITTFDEFLTASTRQFGLVHPLLSLAAPEARAVVAILGVLGVQAQAAGGQLYVWDWAGQRQTLLISTTCIGWQSLILLGLSCLVGLRGPYSREAKVQVLLIGVLGTVLVNLLRMTIVCMVAADFGYWPAVLVHDYGGTLLIVAWLFAFWAFAHRWILGVLTSDELEAAA